jgi:putative ABC transport system ATP-binding protein
MTAVPEPAPEPILVAEGVRKVYRTGSQHVEALRGVDVTVSRGEFVAVMGASGSGKTTLLNCLSGLDEIDAGTVMVEGNELHRMRDAARTTHRARRMGFVFQAFNLIPVLSAAENVELPLLLNGYSARRARTRALHTLDRVGLSERHDHKPNELSGGEQQRVAVARALAIEPALVWADEPTGNLDSATADRVMDLLRELHAEGLTLVLVTHDPAIGQTAQRVVTMTDGAIVGEAPGQAFTPRTPRLPREAWASLDDVDALRAERRVRP